VLNAAKVLTAVKLFTEEHGRKPTIIRYSITTHYYVLRYSSHYDDVTEQYLGLKVVLEPDIPFDQFRLE
jgi:hypothetical protein